MMRSLVTRMDEHPLARRIVSGLEPEFTMRLLDIPALTELRKGVAELMRSHQVSGQVRRDVDPVQMANGLVVIVISLLMATLQTGEAGLDLVAADVEAVLSAATRPSGAAERDETRRFASSRGIAVNSPAGAVDRQFSKFGTASRSMSARPLGSSHCSCRPSPVRSRKA